MAKQKRPTLMSPVGIAVYPRLNKPDTKFDADGVYQVKLKMPKADAEKFEADLKTAYDAHYANCKAQNPGKKLKKAVAWPIVDVTDDDDNPTGEVQINFKMKSMVRPKNGEPFAKRPFLIDGKLKPTSANVGGGSKLRIKAELNLWNNPSLGVGVSLEPKVVQVVDLVEYQPGADTEGFDAVEDGYEAPEGGTPESSSDDSGPDEDIAF
jgi:hypothetical protein